MPPGFSQCDARGVTIMTTAATFQRNGNFAGRVLLEISRSCVDTKLKGIEATW